MAETVSSSALLPDKPNVIKFSQLANQLSKAEFVFADLEIHYRHIVVPRNNVYGRIIKVKS